MDDPIDSEATFLDPKELQLEIGFLSKWVAKEEAKKIHSRKEKEQVILDAIVERDSLLKKDGFFERTK